MKVLITFTDDKDNNYVYYAGDGYPRAGTQPTTQRIDYLLGDKNNFNAPIIQGKSTKKGIREEGV